MLHRVLQEIETASGSINLNELAHKLNIERSALEGMIQFWVRKGRLKDDRLALLQQAEEDVECPSCSKGSCQGYRGCPFVMQMPRTFSLK